MKGSSAPRKGGEHVKDEKALLIELANALEAASALARMIAEREPAEVTITADRQAFAQAVKQAISENPEICRE